ncbi:uncharacterized protein PAC_10666 [Phialocephala subalpina]|uniref:Clr5 domain-containing protein n=1 Tax=Phialocephala subalpina TaxID=576137 RepID=A0A1L7X6W4_9HELO|nr:uncharacterized protein PAC_10666 [Phialocephala subalpina]
MEPPRQPRAEILSRTGSAQKGKTRPRNDAKWESLKDEIFRIYMAEDNTLSVTMLLIEQMHNFKRSPRKWKEKLKEWNFEKNLSQDEMKILVAKAERRSKEANKETIFFHNGNMIPPTKVTNWQRRIAATALTPASPSAQTPASIAYFTPQYSIQSATTKHAPVAEHTTVASTRKDTPFHQFFIIRPTQTIIGSGETTDPSIRVGDVSSIAQLHPLLGTAALKYCELKITLAHLTCRFGDELLRLLFETEDTTKFVNIVSNTLRSIRLSSDRDEFQWCQDLLDLLGQTLIANDGDDTDHKRALAVATVVARSTGFQNVQCEISREHVLGWWFHCGGLYEEAISYLIPAFLFDIEHPSHLRTRRPCYLPPSAADILHESYQKLGPAHEWQAISNRLTIGRNRWQGPLPQTIFNRLREKMEFGDLNTSTGPDPGFTYEITDYIENHLAAVLVHIFHPMQTAQIYCFLARHHLNCLHPQRCASSLLSALESATSVERCQSCRTCITRFLISLTPVCEKMAREGLEEKLLEGTFLEGMWLEGMWLEGMWLEGKWLEVKCALEIAICAVADLLELCKDSAWNSVFSTWRRHIRGMYSDLEQVEETLSDIGVHVPGENLRFIVLGVCEHYGQGGMIGSDAVPGAVHCEGHH